MKKKRFFSIVDVDPDRVKSLGDYGPSVTQPDESLTIQQILVRVSQGLTTGVGESKQDFDYDEEDDHDWDDPTLQPGFDKLDALEYAHSDHSERIRREEKKRKEDEQKKKEKESFDRQVQEAAKRFVQESNQEPPQ